MNDGADSPRLLARERDELEAVAVALREGRRVAAFLVGEAKLRPLVLATLRERSGVAFPEPVVLSDPTRTLDALLQVDAGKPSDVYAFVIDHAVPEVLRTLNWHREKLRRGASALLWLDGIEGLRALRAMAPDAYAFRDVMVVVEGENPVSVVTSETETIDIQLARIPYVAADDPVDRAEAAVHLASKLGGHAPTDEIIGLVLGALSSLPEGSGDERFLSTRAALCQIMAALRMTDRALVEARRWSDRGLADVDRSALHDSPLRGALQLTRALTPLGSDLATLERAAHGVSPGYDPLPLVASAMIFAAEHALQRGDVRLARALEDIPRGTNLVSRATATALRGRASLSAGDVAAAEDLLRQAIAALLQSDLGSAPAAVWLGMSLQVRGEQEAARKVFTDVLASSGESPPRHLAARALAELHLDAGEVPLALSSLRALLHQAASSRSDGYLHESAAAYVYALRTAHQAARLASTDLTEADAELDIAEAVALSIAGDDVPWYSILFPALRAEVLSLRPERLPEAIALTAGALDRARAVWTDAAPMHARMLVAHLARAGRLDEARAALAVAEPEAEAQRHLLELARLRAHGVAILVRAAAPAAEIEGAMAALRATLDDTGAPRIAADTLLDLAILLPPSSSRPDPLALLDEAYARFVDMPIPAQEARCLEAMGDVLAARGDGTGARDRYLAARGTCERFGLGLRVPRIEAKLARG